MGIIMKAFEYRFLEQSSPVSCWCNCWSIFLSAFWYCLIGIAVLAFFYCCLDRIPVRLFAGTMKGLSLWPLLKYGYASTDKRPVNCYCNNWWLWRHWFYNR